MKASKSITTIAAAALVSAIGLAYAQTSDPSVDPSVNPQNSQMAPADQQSPAQGDTLTAPVEQPSYTAAEPAPADSSLNANGATSNAADPNAASSTLAGQPVPAAAPTDSTSTTATPSDTMNAPSNPEPAPIVERAPRSDRN